MKTLFQNRPPALAGLVAAIILTLCRPLPVLHAQVETLSVSPTELTFEAGETTDKAVHVSTEYAWEAFFYPNEAGLFAVDTQSGEGFDFIHINPLEPNTGTTDKCAVLHLRDSENGYATVTLRQKAPSEPEPPEPSGPETIDLAGNWILTRTHTASGDPEAFYEDLTFYDDLGYAVQTVQVGASGGSAPGRNVVTPVVYDDMRRADAKSYLPYVSSSSARRSENAATVLSDQAAWYAANGYPSDGPYAYTETVYDGSPLSRPVRFHRAGADYASSSGNRCVSTSYRANTASEVRLLSVHPVSGDLSISGNYPSGTLLVTAVTDEDGRQTLTYRDCADRTVLTRRTAQGEPAQDTYFVYDGLGRLTWSVTPEGSARFPSGTGTWARPSGSDANGSAAARHCFVSVRDGFGREVYSKKPGEGARLCVYDRAGRLVMSQDGPSRDAGWWQVYDYDASGRLVETSMLASTESRDHFQALFDSDSRPASVYGSSSSTAVHTVTYGSYAGAPSPLAFSAESLEGMESPETTKVHSMKTWERLAVFDGPVTSGASAIAGYVTRAYYYDARGRLIQEVETGLDGTLSGRVSYVHDFCGNVTSRMERHGNDHLRTDVAYDVRGRQVSRSSSMGSAAAQATVSYSYDGVGRLQGSVLGTGSGAVTMTDVVDVRGRMKSRTFAGSSGASLFSSSLEFGSPSHGGEARYGGLVSEWSWRHGGGTPTTYLLYYDGFGRLSDSRTVSGGSSVKQSRLSERGIGYDRNGNVTALTRYGSDEGAAAIATLSPSYEGDRMTRARSGGGAYAYDSGGRVVADGTSGNAISWNPAGLPCELRGPSGVLLERYLYSADGRRMAAYTTEKGAAAQSGLEYRGSFAYRVAGGVRSFESASFEEGRIESGGVSYHLTDHLGSVRAVVRGGAVAYVSDYYPFGLRHGAALPSPGAAATSSARYLFNGKEAAPASAGAYLDYGARFYDPFSGRWTSPDPMAGMYPGFSAWTFCLNNPLVNVEVDGQLFETLWDVTSIVTGVKSFVENVRAGNVGGAVVDGVGVLLDVAAAALPGVPGGVGAAVSGLRHADDAVDLVRMAGAADGVRFRKFTSDNFRFNLKELTGVAPEKMEAHHILPQKFKRQFNELHIDINDPHWGTWLDGHLHKSRAYRYNKEWEAYFRGPDSDFSPEGVKREAKRIMKEIYEHDWKPYE